MKLSPLRPANRETLMHQSAVFIAASLFSAAGALQELASVSRGVLGARMRVALPNGGPVTIILDA